MIKFIYLIYFILYNIYDMKKSKKVYIFKYLNKPLLIMTLIFAIGGAFLILDASSISSTLTYGNDSPYYFFKRQLIIIVISFLASIVVIKFPSKYYKKISFDFRIWFLLYYKNKNIFG